MSLIPDELLEEIGVYLPVKSLMSFALTSRQFAAVVNRDTFWHSRLRRDFSAHISEGTSKNVYKSYFQGKLWRESIKPRALFDFWKSTPMKAAKVGNRVILGDRDGTITVAEDTGEDHPFAISPLANEVVHRYCLFGTLR